MSWSAARFLFSGLMAAFVAVAMVVQLTRLMDWWWAIGEVFGVVAWTYFTVVDSRRLRP